MGRTKHLGAMLLLLLAATAAADERHDDAPATKLERLSLEDLMHVRVRSPTMVSQSVETVPSVISVVTADQIRALGLRTLADALQLLPGVTVLLTPSGSQRVAVRGKANPNDILVTLDGERLNDFYDGSYLTEMPLENVERIELIRGPGSALYGTNAFAGIVSIYSKTKDEMFGGGGGELSFDHSVGVGVRAHAKIGRTWRRLTVRAFASYWESTGPRVLVERDNADPSYSHVPGETNGATRVAMAQLALKREGLLTARDSLELWTAFLYRRRVPYFGVNDVLATDGDLARSSFYARLDYRAPLPAGVTVEHGFHFDRRDASNLIQDQPSGYFHEVDGNFTREPGELFPNGRFRSFSFTTYRVAESSQLEWKLPRPRAIAGNQLIVGALLEYAWLPSFDYGQNFCCGASYLYAGPSLQNYDQLRLTQQHKDRLTAAAFVHDELQPLSWLWITAGLRLDYFSDFGSTWNPRGAVVVRPHRKISFKLLYGRAFRAPSFRDLYDETSTSETAGGLIIAGNPRLRPEITDTGETGFETTPWRLLTLRANAFYIYTTDVIDVDATFTVSGARMINFPALQIWGGEAEAQLHFDESNYLSANLSYFESTQLGAGLPGYQTDAERRFIDTRLNDLPRLRINAVAVTAPLSHLHVPATLSRLQVGLHYHYVAALANDNRFTFEALSVFRQPSFHELGVNLVLPLLGGHLELNTTLELAFGRTIAVPLMTGWYDLPTSGANLFVGLRAHD
jgi:outer membrane receptor for ferrienterochelin and colicins